MPKSIILASRNEKKIIELRELLIPLNIEVVGLEAFPEIGEIAETGDSFAANATLKAETVAAATRLSTLADDSGLCVDALGGAPGIYSARFASDTASDEDNNAHLLKCLQEVDDDVRQAKYVCAIAFAVPGKTTRVYFGETAGRILREPRGTGGFGYDPYFLSADLQITFAEATPAAKHAVSHRGRALAAFLAAQ